MSQAATRRNGAYEDFFQAAFGNERSAVPYAYQQRLAEATWPDMLDVPTGMGKTAAVTLAWLWKRGWRKGARAEAPDPATPRRLIWCLPMRVLAEQVRENAEHWLDSLGISGAPGSGKVSVHVLMGGEEDLKTWAEFPEEDTILVGTQDMLLSRALMRGYGAKPFLWPVHFALVHNDSLWVFDEVQLMGAGLSTSAQLEAFRRAFPLAKGSRTLWVSATLNREWLATVDMRSHLGSLVSHTIDDADRQQARERLSAVKSLARAPLAFTKVAEGKAGLQAYLRRLCDLVLKLHDANAQTLVILNRVGRAQEFFRVLRKLRPDRADLLVHSRYRAAERTEQAERLKEPGADRIVVATQAIEAGVDITSKVLITELAPWASLVQRFGRCNRHGEHNVAGDARILWVDIADDADALPYDGAALSGARDKLVALDGASPDGLPAADEPAPVTSVLRRRDLLDLFNTDPDLSGFDVDVSDYIRDTGQPGLRVFWRDFADDPNEPAEQPAPARDELCPVSIGQGKALVKRGDVAVWTWDSLEGRWERLRRDVRPGMVLLVRASDGGYDTRDGFDADVRVPVPAVVGREKRPATGFDDDWRSCANRPVALEDHLGRVASHVRRLCESVGESTHAEVLARAGRWHDVGKTHEVFDRTMHCCEQAPAGFLAKSPCKGRHARKYFRHELASMLAWLAQHDGESDADLIAYVIAAHHGRVRMSLRAMPGEEAAAGVARFARGIWEGDRLPALAFQGESSAEVSLKLALMEIGEGEQGRSWTERTVALLDHHGPFRLAWLETLVRLADWRASAEEQAR